MLDKITFFVVILNFLLLCFLFVGFSRSGLRAQAPDIPDAMSDVGSSVPFSVIVNGDELDVGKFEEMAIEEAKQKYGVNY